MTRCNRCGAELTAGTVAGLCPVCLIDTALPQQPDRDDGTFRYDLIEEIGRGGMGVVYRAVQHGSQRQVAVKMILAEQAATPGMLERFRAEAEAIASLDHPHILPIYETGDIEGTPFYSMRLASGGTLRECVADFKAQSRRAAKLMATIARAVHHAHERGILHRDLKPGNILLDGKERTPFVSDFGLAKWLGRNNRLTLVTSALGTPHYIAPEQAGGESKQLTPAADVYSLGAILYELLAGRPPFVADTPLQTLRLAAGTPPPAPRTFEPAIPRDLELICLKCLAKEPSARYASAEALAEDLDRWLEGRTILARPATPVEHAWRWTKRNPIVAALSGALLILLLSFLIALLVYPRREMPLAANTGPSARSIAVLPFQSLGSDPENVYFAQGVQDELVTRLAKIADLKVISRGSTQNLKSAPDNLPEIAKKLGVAMVVEGSVRKAGDSVRVNVQLIDALTNAHLWAEIYDRKLADIFQTEADIANAIARMLGAKLTGSESSLIAIRPTENPIAHRLYLKGRYFWNKTTNPDIRKSIDYFNQAIAADANYAPAYAGLADAYLLLPFMLGGSPLDCYPKAKEAAKKAVELDDTLAEAHIAYAQALQFYDFDYPQASKEFERGLQLDPNYANGRWRHSWLLAALGRFDEAFTEMNRAIELDPLSLIINTDLGFFYTVHGQYDQAIEQLHRTLELDPNFYYAHGNLGEALACKGAFDAAIAEYRKAQELNADPFILVLLAHGYAGAGNKFEARKLLNELNDIAKQKYVDAYGFAIAHLALGEKDDTLRWLEKSYEDHAGADIALVRFDPLLAPLRGDPRFEKLADKIVPRSIAAVSSAPEKSIAVLPFVDLSQAKDQEYFCDGISEEILDTLAKTEGLRVVARTSSFSFKGKNADISEIAQKLNVQNVLEGSVRREGNRIRITAQLVDAHNGFHIWSDTFERELQGIFAVQDEITRAIVDALKIKLAVAPPARARQNTEAYDLYLQGLYLSNKSDEESLRKSLSLFQRALDIDPNLARAWTGVAKAWLWLSDAYVTPLEATPKFEEAASKALALDERDAEARCYLGEAKRTWRWDLAGEDAELRRALEIDPNCAMAYFFLGLLRSSQGQSDAAVAAMEQARTLDPLSPIVSRFTSVIYFCADELDKAVAEGQRTAQLDPNYVYLESGTGFAYREKGEFDKAIAIYKRDEQILGTPSPGLAVTYAKMGREADARAILAKLIDLRRTRYFAADSIAEIYAALGEKDEAFRWLDRAVEEHSAPIHGIGVRPEFRSLHSDPRFAEVLRRIGLDPAQVLRQ
ncbi:MAG: protein kinase domain-containing protein [Alphaproteobacteria bacterium]